MNIVICGAGEVGSHAAGHLAGRNHHITIVDTDHARLEQVEERLDIATFCGSGADAEILLQAGCADADWVLATTDKDEINLLTAAIAKGIGARHSLARVHHRAYFEHRGLDYTAHLGLDALICPEYSTSKWIARKLRNPVALAVEEFARGAIEMQQFTVSKTAPAIGRSLVEIPLPAGSRVAALTRKGASFVPDGSTVIDRGDTVVLVANRESFHEARELFQDRTAGRRRVAILGGGPMTVWLCRALRDRDIAIRVFETDRARGEELAVKLDWVTVLNEDPTDPQVFKEEMLENAEHFVSLLDSDEVNIIAAVMAKLRGVANVITVAQQSKFDEIVYEVGVDAIVSPRHVAAREIENLLEEAPLYRMSELKAGVIDVFRVRVSKRASVIGKPLHEIRLTPDLMIAAIQRNERTFVPKASESILPGDQLIVIGRHGNESKLKRLFLAG
jgi:trk system potassium uptake protein TrkA